jgi:hypothetical protein
VTGFLCGAVGSIVTFIVMAALGDMVSEEVRDRLDHLPRAILRLAARQLDEAERVILYEEAWLPDLAYFLKGDEAWPVTRLIDGTRYALGILLSARRSARHLKRAGASADRDGTARSADATSAQRRAVREAVALRVVDLALVGAGSCFAILPIAGLASTHGTTFDIYVSPVGAVALWLLYRRTRKILRQPIRGAAVGNPQSRQGRVPHDA